MPGRWSPVALVRKWMPTIYKTKDAFEAFIPEDTSSAASDQAIRAWRKARISELNIINIASALTAAVVSGTFSWSIIDEAPWTAKAFFYCCLVFALFGVSAASQQSLVLQSIAPGSISKARQYLWERRHSIIMQYVFNLPVRMLDMSLFAFFGGLLILLYERAVKSGVWDQDAKIAVVVSLAVLFSIGSSVTAGLFSLGLENAMFSSNDSGTNLQDAE